MSQGSAAHHTQAPNHTIVFIEKRQRGITHDPPSRRLLHHRIAFADAIHDHQSRSFAKSFARSTGWVVFNVVLRLPVHAKTDHLETRRFFRNYFTDKT